MNSKTTNTDEEPGITLDLDRLKKNCNENTEVVRELLTYLYEKSGPKWIAALQAAIASGNSEELQEICHGMKGASATVFAWKISNLALEFEHLARDGEVEKLSRRMTELQDAFDDLELWVKNHPGFS